MLGGKKRVSRKQAVRTSQALHNELTKLLTHLTAVVMHLGGDVGVPMSTYQVITGDMGVRPTIDADNALIRLEVIMQDGDKAKTYREYKAEHDAPPLVDEGLHSEPLGTASDSEPSEEVVEGAEEVMPGTEEGPGEETPIPMTEGPDPVVQDTNGKWHFWNETWSDSYGPFDTETECRTQLASYCRALEGKPAVPSEQAPAEGPTPQELDEMAAFARWAKKKHGVDTAKAEGAVVNRLWARWQERKNVDS